jgi:hypothetical protein
MYLNKIWLLMEFARRKLPGLKASSLMGNVLRMQQHQYSNKKKII